jgi:hypothetical protein
MNTYFEIDTDNENLNNILEFCPEVKLEPVRLDGSKGICKALEGEENNEIFNGVTRLTKQEAVNLVNSNLYTNETIE